MASLPQLPMSDLFEAQLKALDVRANPCSLLVENILIDGWERLLGEKRIFHIRGRTFLIEHIMRQHLSVAGCADYIPAMLEELKLRSSWDELNFDWTKPFSKRQVIDFVSDKNRELQRFDKALQIILLFEVIARALHEKHADHQPHPDTIYLFVSIEPAASVVHDLNAEILNDLSGPQVDMLRAWTGQVSNKVFADMAEGKTVTRKLAERTAVFLRANVPNVKLGAVDSTSGQIEVYEASTKEKVDVEDSDLPEPALKAAARLKAA